MKLSQKKREFVSKGNINVSAPIPKQTTTQVKRLQKNEELLIRINDKGFDETKFNEVANINAKQDSETIMLLRQKLNAADDTISELENSKSRLAAALQARDEELVRITKTYIRTTAGLGNTEYSSGDLISIE